MAKKIKIAVLGLGRIGTVHALNIARDTSLQLGWIYDPLMTQAKRIHRLTAAPIAESLEQIMEDDETNLLVLCTPTQTHTRIIKQAILKRKAVYCEKPLAGSLAESKACMEFVKKHRGIMMVGLNRRFDPDFLALKKQIEVGALGQLEYVNIISRDPGLPSWDYLRQSGGIFIDMTIHDFDMALYLLPEPPVALSAFATVQVDPRVAAIDYDTASITLVTKRGCICTIHNSRRAVYGYDQRVEAFGSKGMLRNSNQYAHGLHTMDRKGFHRAPLKHFFLERYFLSYQAALRFFIQALQGNKEKLVQAQAINGINAIYLATQAAKAHKTRRFVPTELPYKN